jgi:cell division protein FtsW
VYRTRKRIKKPKKKGLDKSLFFGSLILTLIGIAAVADASSPQALTYFSDALFFTKQQIVWAGAGIFFLILATFIPYLVWKKLAYVLFFISIIFLIAVLIPGVGNRLLGARRWISLGPIAFQPSEIVKLTTALMFARLYEQKAKYWKYLLILLLITGLVMLQPDLGTTSIIAVIGFSQLFVMGLPWIYIIACSLSASILGTLLILTSNYRKERLLTFLKYSNDPLDSSYHIRQVLIALGSGGLWGIGIGQSRQKHLFLPESATDSVFAVIAEETGFVGAAVVILSLMFLVVKILKIAARAPDDFAKVFCVGIAFWIGGQTFLNIASMVSLTPLTGIPLPFFSYGGSSLMMILFSLGIVLNISKYG